MLGNLSHADCSGGEVSALAFRGRVALGPFVKR